jgi:hypothetical protein
MTDPANALSEAAPSLEQLKKLPVDLKCHFLLARLEKLGQHDSSALNKHNLMMVGDPWGLAHGYPDEEKNPVREHLLNIPWTKLVNEGYLVDLNGQGFYKVSEEGLEYLKRDNAPIPSPVIAKTPINLPPRIEDVPRAFVSYSWDDEAHKAWVLEFATRLQGESGVQIILDRWHLHPGQERLHFMEQAVATSDFVIIVGTEKYAQRADNRQGGVGYEAGVITSEMAEHLLTNKFIPALRRGSFKKSLPIYLKGRIGVDLSADPYSESEYERLTRVLYGEPIQPPLLGKKPNFNQWPKSTVIPKESESSVEMTPPGSQRPNGLSYARYDKNGKWITAVVRLWTIGGKQSYSFETFEGDKLASEEFMDTKDEVLTRFFEYHRHMIKDGYKRMVFTPGPDPEFGVLQ